MKREYGKAIADYNELIRLEPKAPDVYSIRATFLSGLRRYNEAIADYNEIVRLNPNDATTYNSLAWLWATCPDEKIRDGKKAVESATKACALTEYTYAFHVGTLAAAHAESGDFDAAVKWQTKANALYSDAEDREKGTARLKLYEDKKPYRDIDP